VLIVAYIVLSDSRDHKINTAMKKTTYINIKLMNKFY